MIIAEVMKSDGFPGKKLTENFYKHDLTILRKEAGLAETMNRDPEVSNKWEIVKDWSEQSRYKIGISERQARDLFEAIEEGVLPWIKARW